MNDKKGLTIVFSVTVVLLIICGGLIATAGFTDINIPVLSDLLNKNSQYEKPTVFFDGDSNSSVHPADYDSNDSDTEEGASEVSKVDDQTEWGSCASYDSYEDGDDSFFGYESRLEYILNSYISGKRLFSSNMFEHIPPEWFPSMGYQIPDGTISLAELRAMSIDERVDFYSSLVNEAEFPGTDFDWSKVNYSFTVSDYFLISDRDDIDFMIRNFCGPHLPDGESSWLTSEVYKDFLASSLTHFYVLSANVDIGGHQLIQVDEHLFCLLITDHNFYIAPQHLNNVMHMLAVYQQQYAQ